MAALAALATALVLYSYLSWLRAQIPVAGPLVPLVVAARDLDPGSVVEAGMVRLIDHPERYLPAGALSTLNAVLGKVLAVPVFDGEAITARKIGTKGGISSVVPAGMRAYSVPVTSGLGFVPRPGDRVDVIVTLPREVLGEPTTIIALRGKEVAAVGSTDRRALGRVGEQLGLDEPAQGGLTITLFVTPDEAQHLAMAEALGRITIVLAPVDPEEGGQPSDPVRPADLGSR